MIFFSPRIGKVKISSFSPFFHLFPLMAVCFWYLVISDLSNVQCRLLYTRTLKMIFLMLILNVMISDQCFEDRKSVFQGHVAVVTSVIEVKAVLREDFKNVLGR